MFTEIFFLMLVVLMASFSDGVRHVFSMQTALYAFAFYGVALFWIAFQGRLLRHWNTSRLNMLAQIELMVILAVLHFGYNVFGFLSGIHFGATFIILCMLALYLIGLYIHFDFSHRSDGYAKRQIKLILPFIIPLILFTVASDVFYALFPNFGKSFTVVQSTILFLLTGTFYIVLMLCFLPSFLVKYWKCTPLRDGELKAELDEVCKKAHFKHGGMLIWTVLNKISTAGIIGVVPSMRYILFTQPLLNSLPRHSIKAVLAHEIGHSHYLHLWIFPYILIGMAVSVSIVLSLTGDWIASMLSWDYLLLPLLFIPVAVVAALYFRYVFGYFSRLFERQADAFGFTLGIPFQDMIQALDHIGNISGNTHDVPSWHHFSINQRIQYLRRVEANPGLIQRHNRKVYLSIGIYTLLLLCASWFLLSINL